MRLGWWAAVVVSAMAGLGTVALGKQAAVSGGAYSTEQAARGKAVYDRSCASCHAPDLSGARGPQLAGSRFVSAWAGRTARELFEVSQQTMPQGDANSLSESQYLDIVAYVLQANGLPAGSQPLQIDAAAGVRFAGDAMAVGSERLATKVVPRFTPVTDAMLRTPPSDEWLTWRRTLDGQGYSPLEQITRDNVHTLQLAWQWAMPNGSAAVTPLVHDGVMYVAGPGPVVQALDAVTGDIFWEYRAAHRGGAGRTMAMYGTNLLMTTTDGTIVAVDAKTGTLAWETAPAGKGYYYSGGPIVADGVVIAGISGCSRGKQGCFVMGHDAATGRELWRTQVLAMPGDPNSSSWGKLPAEMRGGGEMWIPGSYDPKLKLFYIGTSQAKPWVAASRGLTVFDTTLYTNSTLALDPKTGKMAWYFQHVPGDTLDLDAVFDRELIDIGDQSFVLTMGKDGILWKLDRRTGAFAGLTETIFQNVYEVDSKKGALRYRPDLAEAKAGEWLASCPGYFGGHNWQASAYNPSTYALVIPLHQICFEMRGHSADEQRKDASLDPQQVDQQLNRRYAGENAGDVRFFEMPGSDGNMGRLSAYDVRTLKPLWTHEQRASFMTSALTTGGGLVLVGDIDRYFKAFDVTTGKLLWQVRLPNAPHGFPVTYSVRGKQYIAVPANDASPFRQVIETLRAGIALPNDGNVISVFALPDQRK
jgi:PQQ-dependent dehydrogenase (methanol/ethanol family)